LPDPHDIACPNAGDHDLYSFLGQKPLTASLQYGMARRSPHMDQLQRKGFIMPKEEWGVKRVCPTTGKRFYDLNRDPIVSPYTGETVTFDVNNKSRVAIAEKTEAKPADDLDAEDDLLVEDDADIDIDDDLLDDDEDDDNVSLEEIADVAADDDE
jgi:uncharacterized protein (TIGR02300 family)